MSSQKSQMVRLVLAKSKANITHPYMSVLKGSERLGIQTPWYCATWERILSKYQDIVVQRKVYKCLGSTPMFFSHKHLQSRLPQMFKGISFPSIVGDEMHQGDLRTFAAVALHTETLMLLMDEDQAIDFPGRRTSWCKGLWNCLENIGLGSVPFPECLWFQFGRTFRILLRG